MTSMLLLAGCTDAANTEDAKAQVDAAAEVAKTKMDAAAEVAGAKVDAAAETAGAKLDAAGERAQAAAEVRAPIACASGCSTVVCRPRRIDTGCGALRRRPDHPSWR
jgi:hypothetical protein